VAVFPDGPAGAHQALNRSDETCRVLILPFKAPVAIVHYSDSGKVGLWTRGDGYQALLGNGPELVTGTAKASPAGFRAFATSLKRSAFTCRSRKTAESLVMNM
jgi:hypothetical protein